MFIYKTTFSFPTQKKKKARNIIKRNLIKPIRGTFAESFVLDAVESALYHHVNNSENYSLP